MKRLQFNLGHNELDTFFPHERIKTKLQILIILLEAARFLLYNKPNQPEKEDINSLVLCVKKMSRIFFVSSNKIYSINFPFNYTEIENDIANINYKNQIDLDAKTISDILSIIKDARFNSSNSLDFADPICELENQYNDNFWLLLKDLMMMEDGYLRFDKDTESYIKAKEEGREHTHPESHLDIFYSNNNTFKIGLEKPIVESTFLNYVDNQTDCMYLKSF